MIVILRVGNLATSGEESLCRVKICHRCHWY